MIDIAIKHKIYDTCISLAFAKLIRQFPPYRIGRKFKKFSAIYDYTRGVYLRCEMTDGVINGIGDHSVDITYSEMSVTTSSAVFIEVPSITDIIREPFYVKTHTYKSRNNIEMLVFSCTDTPNTEVIDTDMCEISVEWC